MEEYKTLNKLNLSKYEINNRGEIRNINTKKILKTQYLTYPTIGLINDNKKLKMYSIHFLVASIFIDNPNNYNEINHIDRNRNNFIFSNLEWCTHKYNIQQKNNNNEHSFKKVIMTDKNNNNINFNSYKEAYEFLNLTKTNFKSFSACVSDCCNKKQKTAYGYKWNYYSFFDEKQLENNDIWKEVLDNIFINKDGIIYNKNTKNIIKGSDLEYKNVMINKKNYRLHRLIASAFIPNPNNLKVVNHKNGNKFDNRLENLEWVTHSENSLHSAKQRKKYTNILQYDLNNNIVNKYNYITDIIDKNPTFNLKSIYSTLKNKQKTANNYIWKYEM